MVQVRCLPPSHVNSVFGDMVQFLVVLGMVGLGNLEGVFQPG